MGTATGSIVLKQHTVAIVPLTRGCFHASLRDVASLCNRTPGATGPRLLTRSPPGSKAARAEALRARKIHVV